MGHTMHQLVRRRAPVGGAIALTAATSIGLFFLFTAQTSPAASATPPALASVSAEQLKYDGITLLPPDPGSVAAAVPQSVAEAAAKDAAHGAAVKEIVLARLVAEAQGIDQLAWVASLDPSAVGVPSHEGVTLATDWAVVFLDAKTGHMLFTAVVSKYVSQ